MSAHVLLLYGEDDFGIAQRLRAIEDGPGNQSERLFNVSHLDGRNISPEELRGVLYALPLFASTRLVVLSQSIGHFQSQPLRKQFLDIITRMPESTELVLVEPQRIAADHWLLKWLNENGGPESVVCFALKKGPEMEKWIENQVRQSGGKIAPQAAAVLSGLVGDDCRSAYQEIYKLLTYVNYARRIEVEDVEAISVSITQENVFAMVDALGNRDGRHASALLYRLLEERDALSLFQMIVRQFRMILVARELMDSRKGVNDLVAHFGIKDFVARKVWTQARQFSMDTIEQVFHQLLELDYQIKMGEMEDTLALEMFVASFTNSTVKASH